MGTLAVVAIVVWLFPQLRRYGRLDSAAVKEAPSPEAAFGVELQESEAPRTAG